MPYPPKESVFWRDGFVSSALLHFSKAEERLRWALDCTSKATVKHELTKRQREAIAKRCARIYALLREIDEEAQ